MNLLFKTILLPLSVCGTLLTGTGCQTKNAKIPRDLMGAVYLQAADSFEIRSNKHLEILKTQYQDASSKLKASRAETKAQTEQGMAKVLRWVFKTGATSESYTPDLTVTNFKFIDPKNPQSGLEEATVMFTGNGYTGVANQDLLSDKERTVILKNVKTE